MAFYWEHRRWKNRVKSPNVRRNRVADKVGNCRKYVAISRDELIKPSLVAHAFSKLYPTSTILDRLCLTAVLELPVPALRSVRMKGAWAKVPHRLDRVRNDRFSDRHTSHTVAKRKKCLDLFVGKHSVFDLTTQAQRRRCSWVRPALQTARTPGGLRRNLSSASSARISFSFSASIQGSLPENTASWQAPKGALCHCRVQSKKDRIHRVKYWEIIARNIKRRGWSLGYVSAIDSEGRTIWIADAHRDDGKRFVVRAATERQSRDARAIPYRTKVP